MRRNTSRLNPGRFSVYEELNGHFSQSLLSRAEIATIMANPYMIVSAQNNAPVMGPVQNALIGLYLLTNTWSAEAETHKSMCHMDYNIAARRNELYTRVSKMKTITQQQKKKLLIECESVDIYFSGNNDPSLDDIKKMLASPKFINTMIPTQMFHDMLLTSEISMERYQSFIERARKYYPDSFTSTGKLRSRIPGKMAMSILFPATFTFKKTTDTNDLEDEDVKDVKSVLRKPFATVIIENGIVLPNSGPLCKKAVGIGRNTAIHFLYNAYSPTIACRFISEAQKLTDRFMTGYGFSLGISDCMATSYHIIAEALANVNARCAEISASTKDPEDKEREINNELNGVMGMAPKLAKTCMNKRDRNALVIMKKCGAKGSDVNNGQISGFCGQQNVNGKRFPMMMDDHSRTLPHFLPNDNSPEARGFVHSNYIQGLKPHEVFFHAAGGRQGVVDTAVKTADENYSIIKLCYCVRNRWLPRG